MDTGQQGQRVAVSAQAAVPTLWLLRPSENLAPPRRPGCLIHRAMGPTPKHLRARTKIRVGSDFSGMEAGVTALKRMGVPFTLAFSSDNDLSCQKFIRKVHNPQVLFGDVTTRRPEEECHVDIYMWTPPCQSFLLRENCAASRDRGSAWHHPSSTSAGHDHTSASWKCLKMASKRFRPVLKGTARASEGLGV